METEHPHFATMIALIRSLTGADIALAATVEKLRELLKEDPRFLALGKDQDLILYEIRNRLTWRPPIEMQRGSRCGNWSYTGTGKTAGGGRRVIKKGDQAGA
jgi:hypothetical protein